VAEGKKNLVVTIDDVIRREEQQQQALAEAIEQAELANRAKAIFSPG